jgi:hypothetical protein
VNAPNTSFESCQFFHNPAPLHISNPDGRVDFARCCFASGEPYLVLAARAVPQVGIAECCFNASSEADAIHADFDDNLSWPDSVFGACAQCQFGVTPWPTVTALVKLNSTEAIVMIAIVGSAVIFGVLGAFWLRHKCKTAAVPLPGSIDRGEEGEGNPRASLGERRDSGPAIPRRTGSAAGESAGSARASGQGHASTHRMPLLADVDEQQSGLT